MEGYLSMRTSYNVSGYPEYIGYAEPGKLATEAQWQICKLTYDGSGKVISRLYVNGDWHFIFIWNLRTSYSYS